MADRRQIVAFSGMLAADDDTHSNADITTYALSLLAATSPKVCYLPTAVGDSERAVVSKTEQFAQRWPHATLTVLTLLPQPSVPDMAAHLLGQDMILVEGGSVVNLMALWRAHGLPDVLRRCWESGVLLAGPSAGSICWHTGGPTDSFRDELDPFTDGLALLPYSNGVHDDFADQPRRQAFRGMVADGSLPAGYASEDGVALHYVGTELADVVGLRAGSAAWWVEPDGASGCRERRIAARQL